MITAPVSISLDHRLDNFRSGEGSLDEWLKRRALKNQTNGASRTYVICGDEDVIGYYCLAAGAIGHSDAPGAMRRNRPDPIPVLVMGRLAIHADHQQRGLGTALLRDAIFRARKAADIAGVAALLVHALSEDAKRFYLSRGFIQSPIQPMTMCLALAKIPL